MNATMEYSCLDYDFNKIEFVGYDLNCYLTSIKIPIWNIAWGSMIFIERKHAEF